MLSLRVKCASWFIVAFIPAVFPLVNHMTRRLLDSPLHPLVSWYVVVLCFDGRRTGRRYNVPITYRRLSGGVIEAVTSTQGIWWRNLCGGAEMSVLIQGRQRRAMAEVIEGDAIAIHKVLASRDVFSRLLLPVSPMKTVVLRLHFLPEPAISEPRSE